MPHLPARLSLRATPARPPEPLPREARSGFDALFEAEYGAVVRLAARVLPDLGTAEDVAQEVFLDFHLRYPQGREGAGGWLRLAAVHLALNRLRGDRRRQRRERADRQLSEPRDNPEAIIVARETRGEVRQALGRIKARQASLLMLRYSGLSYAEVAATLSIPVNQVGVRLRRAEAALRKEVDHDHPASSR
ncbi:MAG: sigma-70 family RNA polymerase sigma factor [Candidatus Dormibacteria bacterium]